MGGGFLAAKPPKIHNLFSGCRHLGMGYDLRYCKFPRLENAIEGFPLKPG